MLQPLSHPVGQPWLAPAGRAETPDIDAVALRFEQLIAETLLRSARAAGLGDSTLSGDPMTAELVDRQRAEAIARAAPIGIARLLRQEGAR